MEKPIFSCSESTTCDKVRGLINTNTIILTWHKGPNDLRILREFLEFNGHDMANTLPKDDNCIYMVPHFARNLGMLPSGKHFPCKLEVLFPLFFPRHRLVGKNHHALA